MPRLLALPNEIFLQVIENLSHGGLENFALTCKRILNLSWDAIQEKKNTYATISCGDVCQTSTSKGLYLFSLLHDILLDDSIAIYITKIIIGDDSCSDEWCEESPELCEILLGIEHELASALRACPYLDNKEANKFMHLIMTGDKDTAVAFLLTLLPNLVSIETRNCSFYSTWSLPQIISNISKTLSYRFQGRACDDTAVYVEQNAGGKISSIDLSTASVSKSARKRIEALSKVRDAKIICKTTEPLFETQHFGPLLSLPSMQSLSSKKVFIDYVHECERAPNTYTITNIEFENVYLNDRNLKNLLINISSLRHFKCAESVFAGQPYDIIQSLSVEQNRSLVSLDLGENRYQVASRYWTSFVSYLKDFQVLKTIRLDNTMLTRKYDKWTETMVYLVPWCKVSSIVELLPSTVTSLTLAQPFAEGVGRELLKSLPEQKKKGLSGLTEINFEHEPNLGANLEDALKNACIELRFPNKA
ncbi:MAG: hypothetical protein ALECFALPRED_003684 [Alectoria fallacina]|uniref:F-box domain-containing protein n=1 Tax=Alectoria fallacina TaxID=1903189 RepID=A0A8H3FMP0_9LECA|nr:MAG: hypothetical protein ALECFALPRED_003684 [Alectoria fallacina]